LPFAEAAMTGGLSSRPRLGAGVSGRRKPNASPVTVEKTAEEGVEGTNVVIEAAGCNAEAGEGAERAVGVKCWKS